jgi:ATP-dependent DNA ligase
MEALLVDRLPSGSQWQYEPKWDGFRCLAFRDGDEIYLQSKSGQPLARYFPEVVERLRSLKAHQFVLDAEIVIPVAKKLSFDDLLQRIHPAESRIKKLSREFPATLIVFDLLADADGRSLIEEPLQKRRKKLEEFAAKHFAGIDSIRLSPATTDTEVAKGWLRNAGGALDGVIAKRAELPYKSGDRTGMQKIKVLRTADCVIGGFRYATNSKVIGSLLLGLYDENGLLNHIGFVSGLTQQQRAQMTPELESIIEEPGFTGNAPGGPSRWSTERSTQWQPLKPVLVVEVAYDHFTGGRFRHGARLLRLRPDKAPRQCTMSQVAQESAVSPLGLV